MLLSTLTKKIISQYILKNEVNCNNIVILSLFRQSHSDIKVPDFSFYRRKSLKSPNSITKDSEDQRKAFSGTVASVAALVGLYAIKAEINRDVMFMAPSADVLALARIEIKLSDIPEGKNITFKWRGKPLFVRRRNEEQIKSSKDVPLSILRDPEKDEDRCPNSKFLVVIGVCTHLGCVPIPDAGDFGPGGYYCPCHGAHYDASGRTRKGPAPINLVIPEHRFLNDDTLVVG
uniref:Cytochrome b-c1 complex subunit Rieske, mitochondrial n=1 Tax=Diabrotica virgifera virgifera TaxID=50390 RepID=A0A6P7FYW0_DIAVI